MTGSAAPLATERHQYVACAVLAAQAHEFTGKNAAVEIGVELVFDELRQTRACGCMFYFGGERLNVLLHQPVERCLFGSAAFVAGRACGGYALERRAHRGNAAPLLKLSHGRRAIHHSGSAMRCAWAHPDEANTPKRPWLSVPNWPAHVTMTLASAHASDLRMPIAWRCCPLASPAKPRPNVLQASEQVRPAARLVIASRR